MISIFNGKGESTSRSLSPSIRVAVIKDSLGFDLSVRGKFKILSVLDDQVLIEAKRLRKARVVPTPEGIKIGMKEYPIEHLRLTPKKRSSIYINRRRFRGKIDVLKDKKGRLFVVNTVDLEDYVKGVMYHEVSPRWPLESLKAQAVAARTYALYRKLNSQEAYYDVTSDIYSQVYGGKTSERYRTSIAVKRTRGRVMTYRDKILPAYYHATCGGLTEDVSELWEEDLPPLKGVACGFCVKSPHFHWKKNFRLKNIQDKLNENGYNLWLIKDISVVERNQTGRIKKLRITTRRGQEIIISGKDFRNIIGPNLIKSNNYEPIMKGYYIDLIGKGWGHGVGMCQWGANFMSRERYNYKKILQYYYPGVEIVTYEAIGL